MKRLAWRTSWADSCAKRERPGRFIGKEEEDAGRGRNSLENVYRGFEEGGAVSVGEDNGIRKRTEGEGLAMLSRDVEEENSRSAGLGDFVGVLQSLGGWRWRDENRVADPSANSLICGRCAERGEEARNGIGLSILRYQDGNSQTIFNGMRLAGCFLAW